MWEAYLEGWVSSQLSTVQQSASYPRPSLQAQLLNHQHFQLQDPDPNAIQDQCKLFVHKSKFVPHRQINKMFIKLNLLISAPLLFLMPVT